MNSTLDSYSPNLSVKNLPPSITKNNISTIFNKYGKINKIILNNNSALLTFNNLNNAALAVRSLNNTFIDDFNDHKIIVEIYGEQNAIFKKYIINNSAEKITFTSLILKFNLLLFCVNIILLFININNIFNKN